MSAKITIGLEIHLALKTNRKSFSPEKFGESSWISLGFPGTLPVLNLEAVEKTLQLAYVLHCRVNYNNIVFDRKNYFYYDLPKGYQITQYFYPIGKKGFVPLSSGKKIGIKQVHLEEDSAQQMRRGHEIHLNFGRLGRAISEVVTEPDFSSFEEIEEFLSIFRRICTFNGISDASYENGELRIDLNVYISDSDGVFKSEVKNLNSLFALRKSLDHLLKVHNNKSVDLSQNYTYGWVEKLQTCEIMRKKLSRTDYFYVPESNIPRLILNKDKYLQLTQNLQLDFSKLSKKLISDGLKPVEVSYLLDNYQIFKYVNKLNTHLKNISSSYNWIVNIVSGLTDISKEFDYDEVEKTIVDMEKHQKFNLRIAKSILKEILKNKSTYKSAFKQLKISPIVDEEEIEKLVKLSLEKYDEQLEKLSSNPEKLERLIMGECMKMSKGQADPIVTNKIFKKLYFNSV